MGRIFLTLMSITAFYLNWKVIVLSWHARGAVESTEFSSTLFLYCCVDCTLAHFCSFFAGCYVSKQSISKKFNFSVSGNIHGVVASFEAKSTFLFFWYVVVPYAVVLGDVCWGPKCNKVLNVTTFGPKFNEVLSVLTFGPKCNKPPMRLFNFASALLLEWTSILRC